MERMDFLDFIARVTSHIPDKGQVTVRYYGLYANARRGKIKKTSRAAFPLRIAEEEIRRLPAKGWAEMIRKVYEVDRIIDHLKLTFVADRPPLPQRAYQEVLMAAEASTEYFS
jgi:hypothetical protein